MNFAELAAEAETYDRSPADKSPRKKEKKLDFATLADEARAMDSAPAPAATGRIQPPRASSQAEVPQPYGVKNKSVVETEAPDTRSTLQKIGSTIVAPLDAAVSMGTGAVAGAAGQLAGLYKSVTGGKYGTAEGVREGEAQADAISRKLTHQPSTPEGQAIVGAAGDVLNNVVAPLGPMSAAVGGMPSTLKGAVGNAARVPSEVAASVPFISKNWSGAPVTAASRAGGTGFMSAARDAALDAMAPNAPSSGIMRPTGRPGRGEPTLPPELRNGEAPPTPGNIPGEMVPEVPVFPEAPKSSNQPVNVTEQMRRAEVLKRIGIDDAASVRRSALSGNASEAKDILTESAQNTDLGKLQKSRLDAEKQALVTHSGNLTDATGGTRGLDGDALHQRGTVQAAAHDALVNWFDNRTTELYKIADERAAAIGGRVETHALDDLLSNPDFREKLMATQDGQALLGSIDRTASRYKETGNGGLTVTSAEQLRQFMNSDGVWSHKHSKVLAQVKDAIDADVYRTAGDDIYQQGRQMSQAKKKTVENPKGIANTFGFDPSNPINRTTAIEKIPGKINQLDADQYRNLLDMYRGMPQELQPLAQKAIAETQAQWLNQLHAKGVGTTPDAHWNAPQVQKLLQTNNRKIAEAFKDRPDLMQGIQDLNEAGNILRIDQKYPGAGVQQSNLIQRAKKVIGEKAGHAGMVGGAGIGGMAGPMGSGAGAYVGRAAADWAAGKMSERAAKKRLDSETVRLSDFLDIGKKPPSK